MIKICGNENEKKNQMKKDREGKRMNEWMNEIILEMKSIEEMGWREKLKQEKKW